MAVGDVTVSGAFGNNDTAGIKGFIESNIGAPTSGAFMCHQDLDNRGVWITVMTG